MENVTMTRSAKELLAHATPTEPNFVRLVRFRLAPGSEGLVETVASKIVPMIAAREGCRHVTLFGSAGDYGLLVLWESEERAEAAAPHIGPHLWGMLQPALAQTPELALYPVLAYAAPESRA